MGAIRSSATALLSAGATGAALALGALGAPAATAAEAAPITSFGFTITPSTVAPGGQTVLSVTGCDAAFATASSGVFDTVSIARGQTARVTVDRDARVGALYSVSFTCNGETGSADLTIAGGTARPTTSSTVGVRRTPAPIPPPPPVVVPTRTPTRSAGVTPTRSVSRPASSAPGLGVRGGLGGSVAGMDPVELGLGAALVLAGAAGTTYALRRRRSARGH
ncbi:MULTISPECIES: hypothetical protein [unclassified Streptomyces]|uniref:hypothetical protein n=1 Tax=unclassified Streptomyces TaxID=2593676 RepID=UPI00226EE09D|nr:MULTISPECIES: hypothetical protein [unclassified Streptomyces]MCY0923950.1 hypothetical protein [Streptomyces sp. H27-G5]MCY0958088.1 hypothetical protein [Streptomyces sp. H27-H5]